ncbi:unnamed protein product [Amoebophrya sp. A25]|nr:unnamed protein product [Amoebophrya sp. A25]|eukprot:GSA25T00005878001.1
MFSRSSSFAGGASRCSTWGPSGSARTLVAKCRLGTACTSASSRSFSSMGVVGAGQMGTGIALVAAREKVADKVFLLDAYAPALEQSKKFAASWVSKEVAKGRISDADGQELLQSRLMYQKATSSGNPPEEKELVGAWTECICGSSSGPADFVIEAVSEDLGVKQNVYRMLEAAGLPESAVLASNTSSISITKLAAKLQRLPPENFIGMHFMNPVPVMTLVELIRGLQTSDTTHAKTMDMVRRMKKDPATSEDRPGFIANRILMPYINEACTCLQERIGTREDIDKIMKLGTNVPMGPLTLADFIGLDTCLAIMRVLHQDLGDSKYRPSPLLVNYVEAGWLGKKVLRGFYEYDK